MSNLERLGNRISIPTPVHADGYLGRECPQQDCLGYFKITPGTGINGPAPCRCPYCGQAGDHDMYWTQDQIEYAQSVALNRISEAILQDLKEMEFDHQPQGPFGIGFSVRVEGEPLPIRYFREKRLETEVICDACTLRYAIYGAFGFCPDCGVHNSLQILDKNLDLADKQIALAQSVDTQLADHLTGNALEDAVSSFDGFGRETCRVRAAKATSPARADNVSFQNLAGARQRVQDLFGVDFGAGLAPDDWNFACRCFQKRHLLAHSLGVVDEAYLRATGDTQAVVGRKVAIPFEEVVSLVALLRRLGANLLAQLPSL